MPTGDLKKSALPHNGQRAVGFLMEYHCRRLFGGCGHTGWARHVDLAHDFERVYHRNPADDPRVMD